ncbi:MAG: SBBP repeat-containing protein, partial [Bacteroidota bacterium]
MKNFKHLICFILFPLAALAQNPSQQWLNRINGTGDFNDHFNCTSIDASGNIYAAGFSINPGSRKDYLLVKFDAAGAIIWSKTKDGSGGKDDEILAMITDASGNIYVTGYSKGDSTNDDILTIKYDPTGNVSWETIFNNLSSNKDDQGNSIALDSQGNVIVAGQSDSDPSLNSNDDYVLIKYNSSGTQTWTANYNGSGNGKDRAIKVAVNGTNEIFVTGRSDNGLDDDIVTRKYSSAGDTVWTKIINNGMDDRPFDLKLDANSNVYIAGFSNNGNNDDYIALKYTSAGIASWGNGVLYNSVNNLDDRAFALAVDANGNCYLTGRSDSDPNVSNYDFCTIKVSSAGSITWNKIYNGTGLGTDEANSITLLSNGNILISGKSDVNASATLTDYSIVSISYSPTGNQIWLQSFSGVSDNVPTANTSDNSSNVIIVGTKSNILGSDDA